MPTLENNWYRRFLFFMVYFIETIITVLTLSLFPLLFQGIGIDPFFYGVAGSLSLLPMVFKFFIGPMSDRFPIPFLRGKRRGYIILGAILNMIFLPFLALNPITFATLFFVIWFFQTLGLAMIDILTDALAVGGSKSIQNPKGRTGASIWMFSGVFFGGAVASGMSSFFEGHTLDPFFDMQLFSILTFTSLLTLLPLFFILFLKEPQEPPTDRPKVWLAIKRNLSYPFVQWGLLFAFLLNIDRGLLELTLEPFVKVAFSVSSLSEIVSTLFFLTLLGIITAIIGYKFIDRIQKNRLLAIIAAIYIAPSLVLSVTIINGTITYNLFLILYGVFSMVSGLSYVTYIAFFFELSDPKAAGTMIALFFSVTNLGTVIGIACGGAFTSVFGAVLGIGFIYLITALLSGIRIVPLLQIKMADIQETFYQ
ncbi:MAG: MFS transporter [Candidatus Helarchaeota archaeon]